MWHDVCLACIKGGPAEKTIGCMFGFGTWDSRIARKWDRSGQVLKSSFARHSLPSFLSHCSPQAFPWAGLCVAECAIVQVSRAYSHSSISFLHDYSGFWMMSLYRAFAPATGSAGITSAAV